MSAPTDAGGAVSEGARIEEAADAIAREVATSGKTGRVHALAYEPAKQAAIMALRLAALTPAPQAEGEARACTCHPNEAPKPCAQRYALSECLKGPKPLQQGGEVTRAKADVMGVLSGAWADDLPTDQTADAILALFASIFAERDALKAAKWDVKHVDTMNDMVAMGLARDGETERADRAEADRDKAVGLLADLVSWFDKPVQGVNGPVWVVTAGERGADDAVNDARAFLSSQTEGR